MGRFIKIRAVRAARGYKQAIRRRGAGRLFTETASCRNGNQAPASPAASSGCTGVDHADLPPRHRHCSAPAVVLPRPFFGGGRRIAERSDLQLDCQREKAALLALSSAIARALWLSTVLGASRGCSPAARASAGQPNDFLLAALILMPQRCPAQKGSNCQGGGSRHVRAHGTNRDRSPPRSSCQYSNPRANG